MPAYKAIFITITVAITLVSSMLIPQTVMAESWLNDWARQAIVSDPGTMAGNRDTYLTGGRLSMRFEQAGEVQPNIVSFAPPSVETGCGGIDIFGGAIGFLSDPDLLVQRYIDIAQGAIASYAFSLALGLLCDKCESVTRALSSAATELNKLQLSDCQATEGFKTVADDWIFSDGVESKKRIAAIRNAMRNGGDLYYNTVEADEYNEDNLHEGCPQHYLDLFHTNGSLLQNILDRLNKDQQWAEVLSAFAGDVRIIDTDTYEIIEPCPQNSDQDNLIFEPIYIRNYNADGWPCVPTSPITFIDNENTTATYATIYEFIYENARSMADIVVNAADPNQDGPTDEMTAFMNVTTPPIIDILKFEFSKAREDFDPVQFSEQFADAYAHYYAYDFLVDMMFKMKSTLHRVLTSAVTVWQRTSVADGEDECEKKLTKPVIERLEKINSNISELYATVEKKYNIMHRRKMDRFESAQRFQQLEEELRNRNIVEITNKN